MSLTEQEMKLLTLMGEDSSVSRSQLQYHLHYKRVSTVSKRIKNLRETGYIRGPYYHINLNAVGKNRVYNVFAQIHFDPAEYDFVFRLITSIDCWEWVFPTIQGDTLFVFFRSNYYAYLTRLLSMLKSGDIIEYQVNSSRNRLIVQNPNFFGNIFPEIENLFESVILDLAYPEGAGDVRWRNIDLKVMQYLQARTCKISKIQNIERREFGRFWRRSQIKYSMKKIIDAGVAERKHYNISPYPRNECYLFLLCVEGDPSDVKRFIVRFGLGCRMYKVFTMSKDIGYVLCWTSPKLGPVLMSVLERLSPQIQVRCLQFKSVYHAQAKSFNDEHFDFEKQRWIFPFSKYKEEIETLMEKRKR